MRSFFLLLLCIVCVTFSVSCQRRVSADLILTNGDIYTMDDQNPWAQSIAIKGNSIIGIFDKEISFKSFVGEKTRVIDMKGAFVLPGFIDGHVHFNNAGSLINGVNLMTVSSDHKLKEEVSRVVNLLEDGEWIVGGLWGAYEAWKLGAAGNEKKKAGRWMPTGEVIENISQKNPCLLSSFDRKLFLANSLAMEKAGLKGKSLPGMFMNMKGEVNGLIRGDSPALLMIRKVIGKKSRERLMNENRAALKRLRESGIVEIHDIATPEQTDRFVELQKNGELTSRVWLRPDLSRVKEMREKGFQMGLHPQSKQKDSWLRYGALKGYIDGIMGTHGALFFKPYNDQPGNYGHYRRHTSDDPDHKTGNMDKIYTMIREGYDGGFVSNVHAIGTKGVSLMLDTYERLMDDLGKNLEGFRVIHAQVIRKDDFPRFKKLNVIAEVNPYHISDDMRWMEERIGHERCRGAYAFKSLIDNGAMLSFGSDWPGTSAAEYHVHPKYLIHAAVNRTTLKGEPKGGWFPEQKIPVTEALKAYTINNAIAAFEGDLRGTLQVGKLADLVVCDRNLLKIPSEDILNMNVLMTIVDGKIVFDNLK